GECPDSAMVGDIWLQYSLMFGSTGSANALPLIPMGPVWHSQFSPGDSAGYTRISLLKTEPEVPAQIGVRVHRHVHIGEDIRIKLSINPVSTEDLRLRTVTVDEIPSKVYNANEDD